MDTITNNDNEEDSFKDSAHLNYVVTTQKSSAVMHSRTGCITGPDESNLIVSKCTRLEIYNIKTDGLQLVKEIPVNGRIVSMDTFRIKGEDLDCLFILTERYKFIVVQYDPRKDYFVTRASANLKERCGRPAPDGQVGLVDPDARIILFHLYTGSIKVVPIEDGNFGDPFSIRLSEAHVQDLKIVRNKIRGDKYPSVGVLYAETSGRKYYRSYDINVKDKRLVDGAWGITKIEDTTSDIIVPVNDLGGILMLSYSLITFMCPGQSTIAIVINETIFRVYGSIDATRILLCDQAGILYLLIFQLEGKSIVGMRCRAIGSTSCASTVNYLGNGIIFVGSRRGDSQLLHIKEINNLCSDITNNPIAAAGEINPSFVRVIESFTNLGPIVDFVVMDLDRGGECQIVTCSGAFLDGSLRVVRNGIRINNITGVPLCGIKGVWGLKENVGDKFESVLVVTFVMSTIFVSHNLSGELVEREIKGLDKFQRTLACGNINNSCIAQVTSNKVFVASLLDSSVKLNWRPSNKAKIHLASINPSQIFIVSGSATCHLLCVTANSLKLKWSQELESEISCVDISPLDEARQSNFAVIGTWDMKLLILDLENPSSPLFLTQISNKMIPRSVIFATLDEVNFCLCGMGNGQVFTYELHKETGHLSLVKKVTLSSGPIMLNKFQSQDKNYVFASSGSPAVIYGEQKKLMYSNFNDSDVNFLASFSTKEFPGFLALGRTDSLTLSEIDTIQKLHIESYPIGGQPRRICYQPETHSLGILVECTGTTSGFFHVYDDRTFELKASKGLEPNEIGISIMSAIVDSVIDENREVLFIVGTAFVLQTENEPSNGRILVFRMSGNGLTQLIDKKVHGAVYTLNPLGNKILGTINYMICVFEWSRDKSGSISLDVVCTTRGQIIALYADVIKDNVLIGDLMRSMSILLFKEEERYLMESARDFNSNWMTSIKILDEDVYLGCENSFNLFTLQKKYGDKDIGRLKMVGQYHLGEFVNAFKTGSLVAEGQYQDLCVRPPVIFGTVNGQIGLLFSLKKNVFDIVQMIEDAMQQIVVPFGGLSHKEYRIYQNERTELLPKNFIDGDLVETFLNLGQEKMQEVAKLVSMSLEQVNNIVESLNKMH